ncbi:2-C-methyl-D-erythritol 4-phosphate cytidylyltransferase / 2-C-methyl-D-erythritol 2,4-cyclodiphosphate synthase [Beijerinckiaceae bacterium RH AL1]|nr:2-C-methyl-D-erythritol 4-phosphate cytidylyltransferase / 2-C-methyl-D-erythritol 2,4-cyclodiphosphate synthase [Beijerinckiaceae bacterium RH CH11]VVB45969.1 2-C-methyl-D-erythritol 4-phosphate cytidylyltransferase / 2-C-methyl-D-erythritol 2,4-cyclodiphosphate synthase [Beijerinckiaceae bacterium RH AL8]VVC55093.1 2-C-methyl-D-erythritol 4-phosphate cytidylyltransferase / 2-C-methyl-D-erythritol 2,4-cyclodiphosphate synthase [Beijerinckiaceae bacterium RH AL1]
MAKSPTTAILVVAAGRGLRVGGTLPKQYLDLAGRPLLAHTLQRLLEADAGAQVLVVIHPDDRALYDASAEGLLDRERLLPPVPGGATRQASVAAGLAALAALPAPPELVLIHDGARPFPTPGLIARAIAAAAQNGAAVPGTAVTDTIKEVDAARRIVATPRREGLRAVQTPQAFRFALIHAAHQAAAQAGARDLTDDAAIAEWAGHAVHVFEGDSGNMKVTSPEDVAAAEARLLRDCPDVRMGQGYDVHAFGPGDHVWLGGHKVAHTKGLVGHSDADVLSHAITDALYGAIGDGDIGSHFPPSDPKWKGADSSIFLAAAAEAVRARGGMIAHIDATVVCENPKVGPHRDAIRASIAEVVKLPLDRVAVKATTSEKLGFTGREEGIATLAIATVRLPVSA